MKILHKFITSIICFITIITLSGCCLNYDLDEFNGIGIGYSKIEKNAFIAYILRNKEESLEIILPDEYKGIKIKELGGYFGRGVPCPFTIEVNLEDSYQDYNTHYYTKEKYLHDETLNWWDEYEIINYDFEITLPSYLTKVTYISMDILVYEKQIDDKTYATIIRPTYYFKISADNESFYTIDGKLYDKKTDELHTEFVYRN